MVAASRHHLQSVIRVDFSNCFDQLNLKMLVFILVFNHNPVDSKLKACFCDVLRHFYSEGFLSECLQWINLDEYLQGCLLGDDALSLVVALDTREVVLIVFARCFEF